jgi:hypothetical protein
MLLASEGLVFCHNDFGTTPNMAPPSSLKFPEFMGYNFIVMQITKSVKYNKFGPD